MKADDQSHNSTTTAIGWLVVTLAIGWIGGGVGALRCSENLHAGTLRERVCSDAGLTDFGSGPWLVYACAPAGVLLALLLVPRLRARSRIVATAVLAALVVFDTIIVLLAT
jgi:hypothetical protein